MSLALIENEAQFAEVTGADKVTVVMFTAPWCGNCKMVNPKLTKLAKELDDKTFVKVDTTQLEDLSMDLGVSALPTFKVYHKGALIADYMGSKWEKIEEVIRNANAQ
ncbi:Aste57867_13807 [Aphanomyces stellatus]|uniref:Thioredoxin n=1 Tax=Aphanomyces stellatus TaxID=120398 RepID=A0A485KZZ8_9STRA|nr:hypothetical protein As57867_013757 [Aphanomyces stellatus]VFT90639.1 Aste57867_13807 [Aphanomyces stellatus]